MIARAPFVRIGLAAALGILISHYTPLPLWLAITLACGCYIMVWAALGSKLSNIYLWVAIAMTFAVDAELNGNTPRVDLGIFSTMQNTAMERLEQLGMEPPELGTVAAMTIGQRGALPDEVAQSYRSSGMAHLMAVSGLHVGVIFLFVNLLLRWMVVVWHRAHRCIPYLAIVLIWSYVATSGASPSAIRAGVMFSLVQIAMATSLRTNLINTLFAAATMMMAFDPSVLFSVSFQMSFTAVLFIILWFIPLYRHIQCRLGMVNMLSGALLISLVATTALAPMLSFYFARATFASIVVMPLATITAYIIIPAAMLWIIAPLALLRAPLGALLELSASTQNSLSEWAAGMGSIQVRLTLVETLLFYALFLSLTMLFAGAKKELPLPYDNP